MAPFAVQKHFSLKQSHLFIFAFVFSAFGVKYQNLLPGLISEFTSYVFFQDPYGFKSYI